VTTVQVQLRELLARDVMSSPVFVASPDETPWEAWHVMTGAKVRHLVLAVEERCVGIVDDRTLLALWPMGPVAIRQARIGDFVRHRTSCVPPGTPVRGVARVMIEDGVDAVPVVDGDGVVVGLITTSDIVAAVAGCDPRADGDA
jgi:CBS domain-containing protein